MKILFVCHGNICRSPMAEGILKAKLKEHHIQAEVDSAGFEPFHLHEPPDERAVITASRHGIDISGYVQRLFTVEDFDTFDKIFVMDSSNMGNASRFARNARDEKKLDYVLNVLYPGKNRHVPDPWHSGMDGFEKVYQMLDKACNTIIEDIRKSN